MRRGRNLAWVLVAVCPLGCGPPCNPENYCRELELAPPCAAPGCQSDGSASAPPIHVKLELGQYSAQRAGLDQLRIEVKANEGIAPSSLAISPPSALAACKQGPFSMLPGYICDAAVLGDSTLELTFSPPPQVEFSLRVYYTQTRCTSVRTVCWG